MLYAIVEGGKRARPEPKKIGVCPACGEELVSKCGKIMVWHWSHKSGSNGCDLWYEPITEWHEKWLSRFPEDCREVVVVSENGKERHVVDISTQEGLRVDFQSSRLTVREMEKRDEFWGGAVWVLNAETFFGGLELKKGKSGAYHAFEIVEGWHYPKSLIMKISREVLALDERVSVASVYRSQEMRHDSPLAFELWSESPELRERVHKSIIGINAKYAAGCGKRRTPWVIDFTGHVQGGGIWLENGKGVRIGPEYYNMTVYIDGVKGANGRLVNMSDCCEMEVGELMATVLDKLKWSNLTDDSGREWTVMHPEGIVGGVEEEAEAVLSNSYAKNKAVQTKMNFGEVVGFDDSVKVQVKNTSKAEREDSGLRLSVELIPQSCWYSNVRSEVSKQEWDLIRRKCYSLAGHRCEVCGGSGRDQGFGWPVECHEIWDFDMSCAKQSLKGFVSLCPYCHKAKHVGLAQLNGEYDLVVGHMMAVNSKGREEIEAHIRESFEQWEVRSAMEWELDISYLDEYMDRKGVEKHGDS